MIRKNKSQHKLPSIQKKKISSPIKNNANNILNNYKLSSSPVLQLSQTFTPSITTYNTKNNNLKLQPIDNNKSKRTNQLLRQIKPYKQVQLDSESDSSQILNRLNSGQKRVNKAQVVILTENKDKKTYLNNQYIKQSLVGQKAIRQFYERYKNIDKVLALQRFLEQQHTITHIVDLLNCHNFSPRKLDVIKMKGSQTILDLRKLGLGQGSLGPVVIQIVKHMQKFESVDLSYNRIDRLSSQLIIQHLFKVKKINMSYNRIGRNGCTKFSQLFSSQTTMIQELNLQENYILDNAAIYILQKLTEYSFLKKLNLNKNFIGSKCAQKLKQILSVTLQLQQLYINWNQFNQKSTRFIFQGLAQNDSLKVFDYSWNSITHLNADVVGQALNNNKSLVHVDLAFCEINKKGIKIIAQQLEQNHNIYGIHFEGNSGYSDFKGHLRQTQKQHSQYPMPIVPGLLRSIDGVKPKITDNQYRVTIPKDCCWICNSWQEVIFKISKNNFLESKQCYLHLSTEQFSGTRMVSNENSYQIRRMCPRKLVKFFFTFSNGPGHRQYAISQSYTVVNQNLQLTFNLGKISIKAIIKEMNIIQVEYSQDPLDQLYDPNISCIPRSNQVNNLFYSS